MIEFRLEQHRAPIIGVPGPVPTLKIQAYSRGRVDTDQRTGQSPTPPRPPIVLDLRSNISIGGVPADLVFLESGVHFGADLASQLNQEMKWRVQLPRYLLEAIESKRVHDITIDVSVELRYRQDPSLPFGEFGAVFAFLLLKVSEKDWLDALGAMGYQGGWIVEVDRPEIEGWDVAVGFLSKAQDRISSRDPEGAIAQCRAAWKRLKPLLDDVWTGIGTEVDRGSSPEDDHPRKSERIEKLRDATMSWTNTGDHPEHYAASMEDALLAYRLTASLMSFLSRKAKLAEDHRSTPK